MASVSRDPNGMKRILFTNGDNERKAVRLGKASAKDAESFALKVEAILSNQALGHAHDAELSAWLRDLPERTYGRLVKVGLAEPRVVAAALTLGKLLDRFEAAAMVKPATKAAYQQTLGSLRTHFGEATPVRSITASHADEWQKAITDSGIAVATVSKRVRVAKAIFTKAVKWGLIPVNPFGELRCGSQSNPERAVYVSTESIQAIMAGCPDDQWRGIIALSRYAGLRCPSEVVALKWGDVNWERGRLTVRSPKTAGHEGHAMRIVPIAPELHRSFNVCSMLLSRDRKRSSRG